MATPRRRPAPCAEPGCPVITMATRCTQHRRTHVYSHAERERMRATVERWRTDYGDWCPGWGLPPHHADDLTADHVVPRSRGGQGGELVVLCRSCNSRRGDSL